MAAIRFSSRAGLPLGLLGLTCAAQADTVPVCAQAAGAKLIYLGERQRIADAFHAAGLLPTAVDASAVDLWIPAHP